MGFLPLKECVWGLEMILTLAPCLLVSVARVCALEESLY